MKKYLLPEKGQYYKANLHAHTNYSDGTMSPQQVKDIYKSLGYSIVAYTDHHIMVPHLYLQDEEFLPLVGVELNVDEDFITERRNRYRAVHFNLIAMDDRHLVQPFYHRTRHVAGNALKHLDETPFDRTQPDYEREYTPECVSRMMQEARDLGFFVTYNHPTWGQERYSTYMNYHGMHALEIANYGSMEMGLDDYVPRVYDDLLSDGRKILAVAGDDNHHDYDIGGAFTMIKAEKLEYRTITAALERGDFYYSMGPEIYDLWFEDGKVHIKTSPVKRVICTMSIHRPAVIRAPEGGYLTEAEFDILPGDQYFRLTIKDEMGKPAGTNTFYTEDLFD